MTAAERFPGRVHYSSVGVVWRPDPSIELWSVWDSCAAAQRDGARPAPDLGGERRSARTRRTPPSEPVVRDLAHKPEGACQVCGDPLAGSGKLRYCEPCGARRKLELKREAGKRLREKHARALADARAWRRRNAAPSVAGRPVGPGQFQA